MRASIKKLITPKVEVFNPEHSFRVSGVTRFRLCGYVSKMQGVVFTRKARLLGSSAKPHAEFKFRDLAFQIDDGGDMGGDGLWISPIDGLSHPAELREIQAHVQRIVTKQ